MNISSKLSERLKDLMEEAEINSTALGEKIKLEQSEISKYLRAERMPSATSLVKLADYFNCTTDYLIGLSDKLDDRTFKERPPFNEQFCFLLQHFQKSKYRIVKDTKLSEMTVNNWHKGKYEPTVESLVRLAKYFDCSVDYLLGREC